MNTATRWPLVGCLILVLAGATPWYLKFFPLNRDFPVRPLYMQGLRLYAHQWDLPASPYWAIESDDLEHPARSSLVLLEDGRELGPAHSLHLEVARQGRGRYSHWLGKLIFSSSDNTDPRFNKRNYAVRVKPLPKDGVLKAGGAVFCLGLFGIGVIIFQRRRG